MNRLSALILFSILLGSAGCSANLGECTGYATDFKFLCVKACHAATISCKIRQHAHDSSPCACAASNSVPWHPPPAFNIRITCYHLTLHSQWTSITYDVGELQHSHPSQQTPIRTLRPLCCIRITRASHARSASREIPGHEHNHVIFCAWSPWQCISYISSRIKVPTQLCAILNWMSANILQVTRLV